MWRPALGGTRFVALVSVLSLALSACSPPPLDATSPPPSAAPSTDPSQQAPGSTGTIPAGSNELPGQFPEQFRTARSGQIFLEAASAIVSIDVVERTAVDYPVPTVQGYHDFVAMKNYIVVKEVDGDAGFTMDKAGRIAKLPAQMSGDSRIYPSSLGGVWSLPQAPDSRGWLVRHYALKSGLLQANGSFALPSLVTSVQADGYGGLVGITDPRQRSGYVELGSSLTLRRFPKALSGATFLGAGRDSLLLMRRNGSIVSVNRITTDKTKRASSAGLRALAKIVGAREYLDLDKVSPNGNMVAVATLTGSGRNQERLTVVDLRNGRVVTLPGSVTGVNSNDQSAWFGSRWFLAITNGALRILDTKTMEISSWAAVPVTRIAVADA